MTFCQQFYLSLTHGTLSEFSFGELTTGPPALRYFIISIRMDIRIRAEILVQLSN